jgi:hypothetical protein
LRLLIENLNSVFLIFFVRMFGISAWKPDGVRKQV